ncbi:hypothetical protein GCM10011519_26780 [Marmoricola endophyticus]|uniref:Uncharacterized protein n=1 Tax=Marmoricola endophyticus TaxID=2040280 RepID=A0A917BP00_9ACTN|nr:hypothetical protein GCM10011519_26780 [Marmoricola endophyticus]
MAICSLLGHCTDEDGPELAPSMSIEIIESGETVERIDTVEQAERAQRRTGVSLLTTPRPGPSTAQTPSGERPLAAKVALAPRTMPTRRRESGRPVRRPLAQQEQR